MRVHCLQHVPFEDLGAMATAFEARHAVVSTTRVYESSAFPNREEFDLLVVLGGPMSVNDIGTHRWLEPEIRCVKDAIEAGKTVLGICLGAQLIARALGAEVTRNTRKEIGWFPVERSADPASHPCAAVLPDRFEAFHWHGEIFDLPSGAVHLACSEGCSNQGFAWGDHVLALQFHLETTPEMVRRLTLHCPEDLAPGRFVQTPAAMLAQPQHFRVANRLMDGILDVLLQSAPTRAVAERRSDRA